MVGGAGGSTGGDCGVGGGGCGGSGFGGGGCGSSGGGNGRGSTGGGGGGGNDCGVGNGVAAADSNVPLEAARRALIADLAAATAAAAAAASALRSSVVREVSSSPYKVTSAAKVKDTKPTAYQRHEQSDLVERGRGVAGSSAATTAAFS